jgi:hypothetical protein
MASATPEKGSASSSSSGPAGSDLDSAFADDPEFMTTYTSLLEKTPAEIRERTAALQHNIALSRQDIRNLDAGIAKYGAELKQLQENLKLNAKLPYLVANIQEVSESRVPSPARCCIGLWHPLCQPATRLGTVLGEKTARRGLDRSLWNASPASCCAADFGQRARRR